MHGPAGHHITTTERSTSPPPFDERPLRRQPGPIVSRQIDRGRGALQDRGQPAWKSRDGNSPRTNSALVVRLAEEIDHRQVNAHLGVGTPT